PHLDALHRESIRLTDFHSAPMCTATRGQLLTGCDALHNGATHVSCGRLFVRRGIPTMADIFSATGYQTGHFGKWHLGGNYPYRPQDRGFQETVGFRAFGLTAAPNYWNSDYFDDHYLHNGKTEQYPGYCTDVWFNEAMDELDGRDDVRGILIFAHHAPFTNSNVVDPDQSVQSDFVARFCESPKALTMLTGHAHGYERFVRGPNEGCGSRDILFMVSAGGGGPRSDSLRPASETGFTDAFAGPAPRPFHFVMAAQSDDGVTLTVHGMDKGESETRVIESLTLPF
ncbi:MAG: sulfatase-like hydrolase/transferase, partial [Polyangiaceae bacterium]